MTDIHTHIHFKLNVHVNELLKAPRVEDCYDVITTGHLKMVSRILLWLVSHVLRPKNGRFSRIDFAKIHMVYILLNKIKINWPHYLVSCMFSIKECSKGTSFCYVSMITKIMNYFNIGMPNLTYKSPRYAQEFSQRTLTNLGYFKDINHQGYYFRAGKMVGKYNFDDPAKFGDIIVDAHIWMVSNLWVFLMMFLGEIL